MKVSILENFIATHWRTSDHKSFIERAGEIKYPFEIYSQMKKIEPKLNQVLLQHFFASETKQSRKNKYCNTFSHQFFTIK
jgi:hypothetical protein